MSDAMQKKCLLIAIIVFSILTPLAIAQDSEQFGGDRQGRRGGRGGPDFQGGRGGPDFQGGRGEFGGRFGRRGGGDMGPMGPWQNDMQQGPGGMWGGGAWGRGMSPDMMQQNQILTALQNLDTNRNGQIDQSEVQGQNAIVLDRLLRRVGIEPQYPLPLSRVQEAIANRSRSGTWGGGHDNSSHSNNQDSGSSSDSSSEESKSASTGTPLVPGFGVAMAGQSTVPGFGVASLQTGETSSTSSSTDSSSASSATSSTSPTEKIENRIRDNTKALLKKYDTNKNEKLEKDEWQEMNKRMWSADKDKDGIITLDELTEWNLQDSKVGVKQNPINTAATSSSSSKSSSSQSSSGKSKSTRFLSPTERLPDGLPDWFSRNDSDGDGQISMSEYTSGDWTETKAKEFARYDLNNDGIIIPKECLKIAKKK
jgi:Ca2+-binding EF-hand superfamily protein